MKQIELTPEVDLDQVLRQAKEEDIVLMRDGRPVALVSEVDEDELYWHMREQDPAFIDSLKAAREEIAQGKSIRLEDLKRQLGID